MKTIRDILNKRCNPPSDWHDDEGNLCCHECGNNPAKALKEISELLLECKPTINKDTTYRDKDGSKKFLYSQSKVWGYKQGIDDYEKNIKARLNAEVIDISTQEGCDRLNELTKKKGK